MSSASLLHLRHPHAARAHPDPVRIAGLSVAIALNLAVILIATRPLSPAPLAYRGDPVTPVHWLSRVIPAAAVPPPAIELRPLLRPLKVDPVGRPNLPLVTAPLVRPTADGRVAATPTPTPSLAPNSPTGANGPSAPAIEASLAYRTAPLQYPLQAMRSHLHGTVVLRVLVDESGLPVDVVMERSSGHALLDRSAREQVLASWRFQPAMVNGKAVKAWARAPVSFDLREQ